MSNKKQIIDLAISHTQIFIRSGIYNEEISQWGDINVEQGAVIHKDYIIFDPLIESAFGASIHVQVSDSFILDEYTQRCIIVPFYITDKENMEIASAFDQAKVELDIDNRLYSLYYEICENTEVFFKLTLIPSEQPVEPKYLLDDPWGGEKNKPLVLGFA